MTRVWAVHDAVAIHDYVGTPWLLGVIVEIRPDGRLRINLGADPTTIRHPDDVRVVPADQVPIDEQHWVPQKTRDQLVRQEAGEALYAFAGLLPEDDDRAPFLEELADELANLLIAEPRFAAAARVLLAPAPQPAPTP